MKKLLILLLTMIIFITGCSSNPIPEREERVEEGKIKLKFATYFASNSSIYFDIVRPWMARVTELTDKEVQFEYYPSEQLGKAGDLLQLTKDGAVDLSIFPANYHQDLMPVSNMLSGFISSDNSEQSTKAYNKLLQENEKLVELEYYNNGIKPLFIQVQPSFNLWTTGQEIRVPSDLDGIQVRTPGGVANEFYEYIGAVPVSLPLPEVYEALDRNVINVFSHHSLGVKTIGAQEKLNYMVPSHVATAIQGININKQVWQNLPAHVKEAMNQASLEVMESSGAAYDEAIKEFNKEWVASGGKIAELTEEEQKQWKDKINEFIQEWLLEHESDGLPYEEVLNHYNELLKEFQ